MHPTMVQHVEIRSNRRGLDRAYIAGTRVRVQDVVSDHERHGTTIEQIARNYAHVSLAQIHAALAYYFDNRELVRDHMRDDANYAESMREELTAEGDGNGAAHDHPLPS